MASFQKDVGFLLFLLGVVAGSSIDEQQCRTDFWAPTYARASSNELTIAMESVFVSARRILCRGRRGAGARSSLALLVIHVPVDYFEEILQELLDEAV